MLYTNRILSKMPTIESLSLDWSIGCPSKWLITTSRSQSEAKFIFSAENFECSCLKNKKKACIHGANIFEYWKMSPVSKFVNVGSQQILFKLVASQLLFCLFVASQLTPFRPWNNFFWSVHFFVKFNKHVFVLYAKYRCYCGLVCPDFLAMVSVQNSVNLM